MEEVIDEEGPDYCNGNNEMVKISNQMCVIRFERDIDYSIRLSGHQCICEKFHQSKGDINIFKCVVCRT